MRASLSKSPAVILKEYPSSTQWAAVSTHLGEISVPPQKWRPPSVRRLTSHRHSHSVACCPFTMRAPTSLDLLPPHGVSSGPFLPHTVSLNGCVVVVVVEGQSFQPAAVMEWSEDQAMLPVGVIPTGPVIPL